MTSPDGVDRIPYLPPDRVLQTQHTDPDKRQKFSRALEEEEDELEKRRKRRPHDEVALGSEIAPDATTTSEDAGGDSEAETSDEKAESGLEKTEATKHVDVRA
jgi:hypothetical protein